MDAEHGQALLPQIGSHSQLCSWIAVVPLYMCRLRHVFGDDHAPELSKLPNQQRVTD